MSTYNLSDFWMNADDNAPMYDIKRFRQTHKEMLKLKFQNYAFLATQSTT